MNHQEWIRTAVYSAIAAVVLVSGIIVSTRKKESTEEQATENVLSVAQTDEAEQTDSDVLPVAQSDEPQNIDLFSSIHLYASGIYPDIANIHMTGDSEDTFVEMLEYDVTNVSDFTIDGAEIAIEVNTESIADYLEARNYTPYSTTNIFAIEPQKMDCYLIREEQLTDELYQELAALAAEAVTESADTPPLTSALILPTTDCIFTPEYHSYAGLYGIDFFFQVDNGFMSAFVCPVIDADGKLKSQEITLSDKYDEYIVAYEENVKQRVLSNKNLYSILVHGGVHDD